MRLTTLFLLLSLAGVSYAADDLIFNNPSLSATEIVFSHAGDLWIVPRAGGDARRLTANPGKETDPIFSPDGKTVAFSGEYYGSQGVFVVPARGGAPRRLTWNHAEMDAPVAWTPDGKRILFAAFGNWAVEDPKLYTVDLEGSFPEPARLSGTDASYSADGARLAYVPILQYEPFWKHYRGGQMGKIWIANLSDGGTTPVPHADGNDLNPMWAGDQIYFLSDRNGPSTLFSYDLRTRQVKQVLENRGLDIKSASAGPGGIVYTQFGGIYLYDFASRKAAQVPIRLEGDFMEVPRHTTDLSGRLHNPSLSPNGLRAVFEARGDIVTIPADKGDPRNLTNTSGATDREPAWSPKGDKIAYFSDESGEYKLCIRDQSGMGAVESIPLGDKPGYYLHPQWSPDGLKISYLDVHLNLWYLDLAKKTTILVAKDYAQSANGFHATQYDGMMPAWSPDSKWIAYARQLPSGLRAVWVYSLADAKARQLTDGMSDAERPAFDKSGRFLYILSSTNSGPSLEVDLLNLDRHPSSNIYMIVLRNDEASPFLAESDEENHKKTTEWGGDVRIDFEGIGERTLALPMPARSYFRLIPGPARILFAIEEGDNLFRFDVGARQERNVVSGVSDLAISATGEKMLFKKDNNWIISSSEASDRDAHTLKTGIQALIDPRAEWREMYHDAWRIMRELFYDPGFNGADPAALEKRYEPFLDRLSSREDLNVLLSESFGGLSTSHLFVQGGDVPSLLSMNTGLLGADYEIANGRYRFKRVYNGESWNPEAHSPLTRPGISVKAGEYLLAVNGRDLTASQNLYRAFEGLGDKQVTLKVGPDPTGEAQTREVLIRTLTDEHPLRYLAWIEDNRRLVDRLSNGRIAYLHMPDTGADGMTSFTRYFYAQVGKDAAIIDDRNNHGGHLATDIMDYLRRTRVSALSERDGADISVPPGIYGPKVMLINPYGASGGDLMPTYFRQLGVGKLVGERTWGGVVGNGWSPELLDGGTMKIPMSLIWDSGKDAIIENRGTAPDVEVEMDPKSIRAGHDPQLEKAVELLMAELAKLPPDPKKPVPKH
jgi:tricorn protease